jgi:hemolysin III-related protein
VRDPQPGPATPRLRGVTHQWAFVASIFMGTARVLSAPSARARLAAAIYAVSVAALFASSARYHRVRWRSPAGALAGALVIAVWGGRRRGHRAHAGVDRRAGVAGRAACACYWVGSGRSLF